MSECILKSTRCPAGSHRPIKTDPFPKQGTELKKKKTGLFSRSNTYDIASTNIWIDSHVSISSARIPFCHAQISGRSWCWPNRKRDLGWVREIDHIHYRKRKLVTLRLRCENVSNSLNISRTKRKCRDHVRCEKLVTSFGCSSGGTTCPMLQRQQWLVDLFDDKQYDNMLWQSLNSSTSSQ